MINIISTFLASSDVEAGSGGAQDDDASDEDQEDFSFLDDDEYEVYYDCDEDGKKCNTTYKDGNFDYYDYEDKIKDDEGKEEEPLMPSSSSMSPPSSNESKATTKGKRMIFNLLARNL